MPLLMFGLLLVALPSFVLGREFSNLWEGMGGTKASLPRLLSAEHETDLTVQMLKLAHQRQSSQRDPPAAPAPQETDFQYPPSSPQLTGSPSIPMFQRSGTVNLGSPLQRRSIRRASESAMMGQISTLKLAENQQVSWIVAFAFDVR